MNKPTLQEAKEIIELYKSDEEFINENYKMWYSPEIGMDDNSIDLAWYYHQCEKILNEHK